jgi:REP element-mobilizing transposase RayT
MQVLEKISKGSFYHIYNRGINSCNIFFENDNYEHFYNLYERYIPPIADTYAWVLMPNHFHFLVYIRNNPDRVKKNGKKVPLEASQQFSNLFNSYAQAFNKRFYRHGSLFERPFKRKLIRDTNHLKTVILYIHKNPRHHKICDDLLEYGWSSYIRYLSPIIPESCSNSAVELFKNKRLFFKAHQEDLDFESIDNDQIFFD